MKLPINRIALWALNKVVLPAIGKAVASGKNPQDEQTAKRALEEALQDEVMRRVAR